MALTPSNQLVGDFALSKAIEGNLKDMLGDAEDKNNLIMMVDKQIAERRSRLTIDVSVAHAYNVAL